MPTPQYHDTPGIVIAATRWLMRRYQQTGCNKLARTVEQNLSWMESLTTSRQLAAPCQHLSVTRGFSKIGWCCRSSRPANVINCVQPAS